MNKILEIVVENMRMHMTFKIIVFEMQLVYHMIYSFKMSYTFDFSN